MYTLHIPDSVCSFRPQKKAGRLSRILPLLLFSAGLCFMTAGNAVDLTGTAKTTDGTDICAIVLASGQYMFSCGPDGPFSLTGLPRENDGTVKRQIYADGFFPKVDVLADSAGETVVMTSSGICPGYNLPYDPAFLPGSAGQWIGISGSVLVQDTQTPICAMVLANGQYMFSCDATGSYSLNIPLDSNGQYKLQVYADGFAPTIQLFDEFSAVNDVRMARATECQPLDTTPPEITLQGANPLELDLGESYVEPGATALDDVDTDITSDIVIDASAVNTAAVGSYIVTYNVSDSSGNDAPEAQRFVNVVDTNSPPGDLMISDISPDTVQTPDTFVATITGTGFTGDSQVALINGAGPIAVLDVVVESTMVIKATIESKAGGPKRPRVWDVAVTSGGVTVILQDGLTILP